METGRRIGLVSIGSPLSCLAALVDIFTMNHHEILIKIPGMSSTVTIGDFHGLQSGWS